MSQQNIKKISTVSILAGAVALAGCQKTSEDKVYSAFHREAGSIVDNGSFGNASMNNMLVQTGQRSFAVALGERFAKEVPSMVNFAFNSATLDNTALLALDQQANFINQFPEVRFKVYGHTDAVGSNAYNKRLGLRRARAVVRYLTSKGVSRSRLQAVVSFGETRPVIATQEREVRNRRTVTEVSGFVGRHPTVLDGKYAQIVYRDYITSAQSETRLTGITGRDFQTEQ
jgi:outer membrane protein OmpA-like peptidoglycan-associated protein